MTIEQTKPLTMHARHRPPPQRVLWFERLFYASAFLSVIGIGLEWADGIHIVGFVLMYATLCLQVFLIWQASRRRKNWARWLLVVFFLVWVIANIMDAGLGSRSPNWEPPAIPQQAVKIAKILLEDIGLILIFTGSSRRWFHPRPQPTYDNPWGRNSSSSL